MQNVKELLAKCQNIAGMTLTEVSRLLNTTCPKSLNHNKGWIGQLLEKYLGATGYNLPIADFPELGIELKTIPINPQTLSPLESTYICTAPLNTPSISWEQSVVKLKLSKILWVPIEWSANLSLPDRRIGKSFLWQPSQQQAIILENDWQELTEMIQLGNIQLLSARYGRYLQIRPKAATCKNSLVNYLTSCGEIIKTVNRGFYLRASFTKKIFIENFSR